MGDGNGAMNGHAQPGQRQPAHVVQIVLYQDGQIEVAAPLTPNGKVNEMPALYLLERGRMLIEDRIRSDQQDRPLIERVDARFLPKGLTS